MFSIASGGIKAKTKSMRKIIAKIWPNILPIIDLVFFAASAFFLRSLTKDHTIKMMAMTQNDNVNIPPISSLKLSKY